MCYITHADLSTYCTCTFTNMWRSHRVEARACADVCSAHMPEHVATHGHMQKYTCTYESINNFKLSAFLYTVCGVRLSVLCLS